MLDTIVQRLMIAGLILIMLSPTAGGTLFRAAVMAPGWWLGMYDAESVGGFVFLWGK